jgi:arylformamidase
MKIHDVTRPVRTGMPVWPGDPNCRIGWAGSIEEHGANVAELRMSVHTGTHADGPYHVLEGGARIGDVPLEAFVGRAVVVDATATDTITAAWLKSRLPRSCERVLLRTGAWVNPAKFPRSWPVVEVNAARYLVERKIRLLGTDAPSPEAADAEDLAVHRLLLESGVAIVENLLLDGVAPGEYELIALPLRLAEADASPVRAVLLER